MPSRRIPFAVSFGLVALFAGSTSISAADTSKTRADIPVCTEELRARWLEATQQSLGVDASDPEGGWIGSFAVYEKDWWNGDDEVYFPYDSVKTTLCGVMAEYTWHDESFSDEADWNLNIVPSPFYQSLLRGPAALSGVSEIRPCPCPTGADLDCVTGESIDCMQAEITPDEHVYQNPWFPNRSGPSAADGKQVCVYGPWVGDAGHGRRPEIHPAEIIWWRDPLGGDDSYTILLVHDDSNRFDRAEWGEWYYRGAGADPFGWRPWSAPPRTADVQIAFQAIDGQPAPKLDVREIEGFRRHVTTSGDPVLSQDTDDGRHHALIVDGQTVVEVDELQSRDDDLGVRFTGLCRSADGSRIEGFVGLTARLSENDAGREGFFPLNVVRTTSESTYDPPTFPILPLFEPLGEMVMAPEDLQIGTTPWGPDLLTGAVLTFVPLEPGTGLAPIEELVVEGPEGSPSLALEFDLTEAEGGSFVATVAGFPTFGVRRLVIGTGAGTYMRELSGHALWHRYRTESPFDREAEPEAWETIAEAAGGVPVEPPAELAATSETFVELGPELVPRRGDSLQPEGNSAVTQAVSDTLAAGDPEAIARLFGTESPYAGDWGPITARDLSTGEPVEVVEIGTGMEPPPDAVAYERLPATPEGLRHARFHFPKSTGRSVIEVEVAATVTDPFGSSPEARTTLWSHGLRGTPGEELADALLVAAARMRELDPEALLAQSALEVKATGAVLDRVARAARSARLQALRAADDGLVTPAELETVLAAVTAWSRTAP